MLMRNVMARRTVGMEVMRNIVGKVTTNRTFILLKIIKTCRHLCSGQMKGPFCRISAETLSVSSERNFPVSAFLHFCDIFFKLLL